MIFSFPFRVLATLFVIKVEFVQFIPTSHIASVIVSIVRETCVLKIGILIVLSDLSVFFFYIDFISKQCLFLNLGFKRTRTHYNVLTFASWYICLYFSLTNLLQTKGHGAKVTVVCKEGLAMDPVLGPRLDNPTKQNDKARPLSQSFTPVSYYAGMWIKIQLSN